jgi:hypothetical protein
MEEYIYIQMRFNNTGCEDAEWINLAEARNY